MRRISLLLLMALTVLAARNPVEAESSLSVSGHTLLDETGSQLREDFNRAQGSVRLLFVVDPICPGCLRGLDDISQDVLATIEDKRLQTFVVHVPVLSAGAKAKDVAPAAKLLRHPNVRHYWNPSGSFGRTLSEAVGLNSSGKQVYAWDVWLVYGPEASWDDPLPPRPRLLMHQLRALQGNAEFPRLDSKAFAREVNQLLAQLPAETSRP